MASTPQTDNEISVRKVDVANSVRQIDQIFADRLFLLEQKLHGLENKTEEELRGLSTELKSMAHELHQLSKDMTIAVHDLTSTTTAIRTVQQDYAPTMVALTNFFAAGRVIKIVWMSVTGFFAAVGALMAVWDKISVLFT